MKILHIVDRISLNSGGMGLAALRIAQCANSETQVSDLFVIKRDHKEYEQNCSLIKIKIYGGINNRFIQLISLLRLLSTGCYDIIHIHGLWTPELAISAYFCIYKNIKFVISPHGCLDKNSMSRKNFKKKIAMTLYQRTVLDYSSLIIVTADSEKHSVLSLNLKLPKQIAIIPCGVDKPTCVKIEERSRHRTVLFLSRVHPGKGVLELLEAWLSVKTKGWKLVIAGPGEPKYLELVKTKILESKLSDDVDVIGLVSGEIKDMLYISSNIFILPTYSENFGLVVAEALVRALPVITTKGAPWGNIESHRCGWWVDMNVESIKIALSEAMSLSDASRYEMGKNGHALINSMYLWESVGVRLNNLYNCIHSNQDKISNKI